MKSILGVVGLFALVACSGAETPAEGRTSSNVVSNEDQSYTLNATENPELQPYGAIWNIRNLDLPENDIRVKLVETGGGDPAINGNILYLVVNRLQALDENGEQLSEASLSGYPLGNVRSVERAERTGEGTVSISVTQDSFDENGDAIQETRELSISLGLNELAIATNEEEIAEIVSPYEAAEASVEEAALYLDRVETSRFQDDAGNEIIARVYAGGGQLALNLMQYPTEYTFDLSALGEYGTTELGMVVPYPAEPALELEITEGLEFPNEAGENTETNYHFISIQYNNGELLPQIEITKKDAAG